MQTEAQTWQVTYFNTGTGRRHVLIDGLPEADADCVVERFGDAGDEFHRLPQVRKERMPASGQA